MVAGFIAADDRNAVCELGDSFDIDGAVSIVTADARIYIPMGELIDDIAALGLRNRSYAVIENGTWAPSAGDKIDSVLSSLKGFEPIAEKITIRSAPTEIDAEIVRCLGHKISRRILH